MNLGHKSVLHPSAMRARAASAIGNWNWNWQHFKVKCKGNETIF